MLTVQMENDRGTYIFGATHDGRRIMRMEWRIMAFGDFAGPGRECGAAEGHNTAGGSEFRTRAAHSKWKQGQNSMRSCQFRPFRLRMNQPRENGRLTSVGDARGTVAFDKRLRID